MLPNSSDIEYFIEVALAGNISRAAERIGITQPSLSLSIKRLEDVIGTQLLIRTKSGVKLTNNGQSFLSQSKYLLQEWEKIRSLTLKQDTEIRGQFSIGCHNSVALYTLPHFIPQLVAENPGLEFKFKHDHSRKITEEVISFKLDFGIVVNPVQHPDLVIKELGKDVVTLWTSVKNSPNNHKDTAVLICDPELFQTQSILKSLKKSGYKVQRHLFTSSLELVTSLVEAQAGIGIIPTRVKNLAKSAKLKPIAKAPEYLDKICLIYRSDMPKTTASQYIVKEISNSIKNLG